MNSDEIGFSDMRYRKNLFDNQSEKCKKAGMENPPFLPNVCKKFSGGRCPPEPPRLGHKELSYMPKKERPRGNGASRGNKI